MMTESVCVCCHHKLEVDPVSMNLEILPFPRKMWAPPARFLLLVGRLFGRALASFLHFLVLWGFFCLVAFQFGLVGLLFSLVWWGFFVLCCFSHTAR